VRIEQRDRFRWGPIGITWGEDFEVRITCPRGATLDLTGGSTDVYVEGDLGEVNVRTASGDVKLDDVEKRIQLKTASGDVRVGTIASGGSVGTVSGDLAIRRIEGEVTSRSVSGDIVITSLHAPLELATTSGDVRIESIDAGEVRAQTVSGDVMLGVASGTRVWIDATSVSGDLQSQLGLEENAPAASEEQQGDVVPLHVKTVSGDVQILRANEAFTF
jgi:DUF4097 and DUF4098 domain-containing protein YvlB